MVTYAVTKIMFMKIFSYMKNSHKGMFRDESKAEETLDHVYLHMRMFK